MSPELVTILRHSLGLRRDGSGSRYRNHYVAGGKDLELCRELAGMGLMEERPANALTGWDPVFIVTLDGIAAAEKRPSEMG